uniref:Uncharacterized protein n=1 Tax=Anguilla anguilla TaxID=7936 RepID=A0A0E9TWM3_ANGAN
MLLLFLHVTAEQLLKPPH